MIDFGIDIDTGRRLGSEFAEERGIVPLAATYLSWPSRAGYVWGVGIYVLRCPDGRLYVGQSRDLERRRLSHLTALRAGSATNARLQTAFDATDEMDWEFLVLARLRVTRRFSRWLVDWWLHCHEARWYRRLRPELNSSNVPAPWGPQGGWGRRQ